MSDSKKTSQSTKQNSNKVEKKSTSQFWMVITLIVILVTGWININAFAGKKHDTAVIHNQQREVDKLKQDVKEWKNKCLEATRDYNRLLVDNKQNDKENTVESLVSIGTFEATAYDLYETPLNEVITSDGTDLRTTEENIIAVDPNIIPLGSKVYIEFPSKPGYNGFYTARDTGSLIKQHRLDVFVNAVNAKEHETVTNMFGSCECEVYIIKE